MRSSHRANMSTICSAGHRRRVEEVNEAVLPPRVQLLPHTSLDVLFNTARKALWQVPWLWGRLPCCWGPYHIQELSVCWAARQKRTGEAVRKINFVDDYKAQSSFLHSQLQMRSWFVKKKTWTTHSSDFSGSISFGVQMSKNPQDNDK